MSNIQYLNKLQRMKWYEYQEGLISIDHYTEWREFYEWVGSMQKELLELDLKNEI